MSLLLGITLFELFVGGGGRLTAFGPVSLRMVLFGLCLCAALFATLSHSRRSDGQKLAVGLVLAYLLIHVLGVTVGATRGGDPREMWTELQPTLYWLMAPYFAMELTSSLTVRSVGRLVELAALLLALAYIGAFVALTFGAFDIKKFFSLVANTEEFRNRGDGLFFYKGFLYLGIGAIFIVANGGRLWLVRVLVVICALAMTLTRGFVISTTIAMWMVLMVQRRRVGLLLGICLMGAASVFVWNYAPALDNAIGFSRSLSNDQRLDDINFIGERASAVTLLVGEGFGSLINDRNNIEDTFLWALWKLGVPGLIFWLMPMAICAYFYLKVPQWSSNRLATGYFFGTVLVYIETATNPYLNDPIGLSYVIVSIFALRTLSKSSRTVGGSTSAPLGSARAAEGAPA